MSLVDTETGEVVKPSEVDFPVHPAADWFPMMEGEAFDAFVEDIRQNGQMEEVVLDRAGQVIDGRNRLRACKILSVIPRTSVYTGDDVYQYVVSHNLHRRHLTDGQRAMIAARLAQRPRGGDQRANGDITDCPPTRAAAAEMLGVTDGQVGKAKQVLREGTEGLIAAASDGSVPVATAARVATELSPEEQDEFVEKVRAGADPVKVAPPDEKKKARDARRAAKASVSDGAAAPAAKRTGPRRKHAEQIDALVATLDGAVMAFSGIRRSTDFDKSVTKEEAVRLTDDLSRQIRVLNRINSLLKERTS